MQNQLSQPIIRLVAFSDIFQERLHANATQAILEIKREYVREFHQKLFSPQLNPQLHPPLKFKLLIKPQTLFLILQYIYQSQRHQMFDYLLAAFVF